MHVLVIVHNQHRNENEELAIGEELMSQQKQQQRKIQYTNAQRAKQRQGQPVIRYAGQAKVKATDNASKSNGKNGKQSKTSNKKKIIIGVVIAVVCFIATVLVASFIISSKQQPNYDSGWNAAAWQNPQGITSEEAGLVYESIDSPSRIGIMDETAKSKLGPDFREWCTANGYGTYPNYDSGTQSYCDDGTTPRVLLVAEEILPNGMRDIQVWAVWHADTGEFTFEPLVSATDDSSASESTSAEDTEAAAE